ncbi:hypothetical protein D3C75_1280470 [compost metagenome]
MDQPCRSATYWKLSISSSYASLRAAAASFAAFSAFSAFDDFDLSLLPLLSLEFLLEDTPKDGS